MFSTFEGKVLPIVATNPEGTISRASSTVATPPKRSQIGKACNWCRAYRIKCDNNNPCNNCRSKSRECSKNGVKEVRTFSQATREIERLNLRIKELEDQLENCDGSCQDGKLSSSPHLASSISVSLPTHLDPRREHGGNRKYWECIRMRTAQSPQRQCYGPASSFYFIGRIGSYLSAVLQQPHLDRPIQLDSASKLFASPAGIEIESIDETTHEPASKSSCSLSRVQEEQFLNLFWQSYYCSYPVINETEFKEHYKSLWFSNKTYRRPSALVDIVLAICVQHGTPLMPPKPTNAGLSGDISDTDERIAGRWFYRRCQALLTDEFEGPSLATFQCHLFSVIYLCNASFQNIAYSTLAVAVRTGIILGLHLEPPEDVPDIEKEFRRRLWWTLYALEMKICMELGRPLAVNISQVTCSLPSDARKETLLLDSSKPVVSVPTFNTQYLKLILATRATYVMFYARCADLFGLNGHKSLYNDNETLETSAEFLSARMEYLQTWLKEVPETFRTRRKGTGEPFSTDRSQLEILTNAPFWLQRQRLLLELLYHDLSMSLYRPFISFSQALTSSTPLAEGNAISCLNHAIAITLIIHQCLTETDILSGWYEVFQRQWNATLSLIGYILAYPMSSSTLSARKAISTSIDVFEMIANNFAIANSAAAVTRDLLSKADLLVDGFRGGLSGHSHYADEQIVEGGNIEFGRTNLIHSEQELLGAQDVPQNSTGLSIPFDPFHSTELFGTTSNGVYQIWDFDYYQQSNPFMPWIPTSLEADVDDVSQHETLMSLDTGLGFHQI